MTTEPLTADESTATPPSMIADLPDTERPRERLLENGAGALNDTELVAVMLRTGKRGQSVIAMSREILAETGGLAGLVGLAAARPAPGGAAARRRRRRCWPRSSSPGA